MASIFLLYKNGFSLNGKNCVSNIVCDKGTIMRSHKPVPRSESNCPRHGNLLLFLNEDYFMKEKNLKMRFNIRETRG